jgi:hypothetical protein
MASWALERDGAERALLDARKKIEQGDWATEHQGDLTAAGESLSRF